MKVAAVKAELKGILFRSAWKRGVKGYALGMLEDLEPSLDLSVGNVERILLNGTFDWGEYSWGGCALIFDEDIASALCSPSELAKVKGGRRRPNGREEWLDVQARACAQACELVKNVLRRLEERA